MKGIGASSVYINTLLGNRLFDKIKKEFFVLESDLIVCDQPNLNKPTIKPLNYNEFWKYYVDNGFNQTVRKFVGNYKKVCVLRTIKIVLNEMGILPIIKWIKGVRK